MCLIVQRKPGTTLDPSSNLFRSAYNRNKDGWGVMYAQDNQIIVEKGFDIHDLAEYVQTLNSNPNIEYFVHFRMATHGRVIEDNIHPFHVGHGIYMMHNGVLNISAKDDVKSDTAIFADAISKLLEDNPDYITSPLFKQFCDMYAGNDRLLFLTPSGESYVYGRGTWVTHKSGLILSNTYAWSDDSPVGYRRQKYPSWYYDPMYADSIDKYYDSTFDFYDDYYSMHGVGKKVSSDTSFDFYDSDDDEDFDLPSEYAEILSDETKQPQDGKETLLTLEELLDLSLDEMHDLAWKRPTYFSRSVYHALSSLIGHSQIELTEIEPTDEEDSV